MAISVEFENAYQNWRWRERRTDYRIRRTPQNSSRAEFSKKFRSPLLLKDKKSKLCVKPVRNYVQSTPTGIA